MNPRKNVEIILNGGQCSKVPFTMYEGMIPQCRAERDMRNRGLCIVQRIPVFTTHKPNVKTYQNIYYEYGRQMIRTTYETPHGNLTSLSEKAGFTSWHHEKMFKGVDDYKKILFMIQDEQYTSCYEHFVNQQQAFGDDAIFRAGFGLEPLQTLITGGYLDMQDFCIEWMENRDELLKLYDAIVDNKRKIYPIVAKSPALHANYGGNVTPEIIGLKVFEQYYLQHYSEAAEIMRKHGKLIGCHFDANCKLLSKAIASTSLDYIEAFTPAPDTDMTLSEAREAWPDKVLWLNFPSSVHLKNDEEVEQITVEMLDSLDSADGVIMGITENIPENRWRGSCVAIMDGLDRHAKENPMIYKSFQQ